MSTASHIFSPSAEQLTALAARVQNSVGAAYISHAIVAGELCMNVHADSIATIAAALRDDADYPFCQLVDVTAIDNPSELPRFTVVYNLLSLNTNMRLRLKCAVDDGAALPSVVGVWPTANWFEREVWDLFGIPFSGHPDLRRILTDYGFEGHPLRKDFPLTGYVELRYDDEQKRVVYEPVKLNQDFRQFDFLSPWEGMNHLHHTGSLPGDEKAGAAS